MDSPSVNAKLQPSRPSTPSSCCPAPQLGLVCAPQARQELMERGKQPGLPRAWHGTGTCHTPMFDTTPKEFSVKLHPLLPPRTREAGRQHGDQTTECKTKKQGATLGKRSQNKKIHKLSNQVIRTLEKVGRDQEYQVLSSVFN